MHMLRADDHPVLAFGLREGQVGDVSIQTDRQAFAKEEIDTVTLYVGPQRQGDLLPWLLELRPKRVIFNPGTENGALASALEAHGIEPLMACTLVMLSTQQY